LWGALIDRFSNKAVLEMAAPRPSTLALGVSASGVKPRPAFRSIDLRSYFGDDPRMGVPAGTGDLV
jgi:hypothetical protein